MENVVEIYKISFFKKSINGRLLELMSSTSEVLDQFITDYDTADLVDRFVISYIDSVQSGQTPENIIISESMVAVRITNSSSAFFTDPGYQHDSPPALVIPTDHLRQIALLWRDFLQNA